MAVRLNVLLVQSPRMTPLQANINAEVAVQLMGVPGMDLAILDSLGPEIPATDRLLLGALTGDLAILDWRAPEETVLALERLGIAGHRASHRLDPASGQALGQAPQGARRLYLVDLRRGDSPAEVLAGLQAILASRRVVTVSLGAPAGKPAAPAATPPPAPALAPEPAAADSPAQPPDADEPPPDKTATDKPAVNKSAANEPAANKSAVNDSAVGQPSGAAPAAGPRGSARGPQESDLDALVEQVNRSNW